MLNPKHRGNNMSLDNLSPDEVKTYRNLGIDGLNPEQVKRYRIPDDVSKPLAVSSSVQPQDIDQPPYAAVLAGKGIRAVNSAFQTAGGSIAEETGRDLGETAGKVVSAAMTPGLSILDFLTPKNDDASAMSMMGNPSAITGPEGMGKTAVAAAESFPGELDALKLIKNKMENTPNPSMPGGVEDMLNRPPLSGSGQMASDTVSLGQEGSAKMGMGEAGKPMPEMVGKSPADEFKDYLKNRIDDLSMPTKDRTRVVQPGPLDKIAGNAWSAASAIRPSYASAIIADGSIMDPSVTPSVSDVSKEYTNVFKKAGMSIDSDNLKKILGQGYFPNEGQTSQHLNNITNQLDSLSGLKPGESPDPSALFVARSEAAAVKRSTAYATNPSLRKYVDNAQDTLDTALEGNGMPEIKDLSAKFFRAKAQEAGSQILPLNKNQSPNVLRTLLMARNIAQGVGGAMFGPDRVSSIGQALGGLAMSPAVGSGAIRAVSGGAVPGTAGMSLNGLGGLPLASLNRKEEGK